MFYPHSLQERPGALRRPAVGRPCELDVGVDMDIDDVDGTVEGQRGRRQAAVLTGRRWKADQRERSRRRRGGVALPGAVDGGRNPP